MNTAQINTIQSMLSELTAEQLVDVENVVASHYRTNIVQRIQWFETSELLQVGAFIGAGGNVYEEAIASSTVIEPTQAAEEAEPTQAAEEEQETELEPYDDEAHEKVFLSKMPHFSLPKSSKMPHFSLPKSSKMPHFSLPKSSTFKLEQLMKEFQ